MTAPLLTLCPGCGIYLRRRAVVCWRCGRDNPHGPRKAGRP